MDLLLREDLQRNVIGDFFEEIRHQLVLVVGDSFERERLPVVDLDEA